MVSVAIAGASGYAGGELIRILGDHPFLEISVLAAGGRAGESLRAVHPNLSALAGMPLVETTPEALAGVDVLFLALPHGESAALVSQLPADLPIVDLGADFRLNDGAQWDRYYGGPHAGTWVYGLPELPGQRALIAGTQRVANPGCYATAVAVALAPLLGARLVSATGIVVVAASGTSGAGRKPSDPLLATQVMGSMSAYKVGGVHQHTPEMEQSLSRVAGEGVEMSFTPLLAPMSRGIIATCTAEVDSGVTESQVRDSLMAAYEAEPFISVLPSGVWPQTSSVAGTNMVQLQCALDTHAGRVIVVSAIDNLGKGAAGQAVQNANLMFAWDEMAGLSVNGVAP